MKKIFGFVAAAMLVSVALMTGCFNEDQKVALKDAAHQAILNYLQTDGQEKAVAYIDKLVAEGKLGSANAEKIKAAIPLGIEELRRVMREIEAENEAEEK